MKIETFNTMNLIPIGDVRFRFDKKQLGKGTKLYVGDIHIMCNTDRNISKETFKALMKMMKKAKSDLLTDGHDYFTTRGEVITQIDHSSFNGFKEDHKEEIDKLLYG